MNRKERRAAKQAPRPAAPKAPAPASAQAIDLLALALERDPHVLQHADRASNAYNNHGIALRNQGRLAEAVASYELALALKPDNVEASNNLGVALQDQGRLAEALARYRRALDLRPDYAEAHNNLGGVYELQGRLADAVACYRRAVALRSDIADLHYNLANALRDLGKLDEAVAPFEQALALNPGNAEAHYNLGLLLRDRNRKDEAIASYERAIALGHKAAAHMAAALKGETTEQPPPDYVLGLFDGYAPRFESDLVGKLGYKTPETLRLMMEAACPGKRFARTVDLGCGTGLMGVAFRNLTGHLAGVDLAPKMIEQSAKKAIYDRLEVADIVAFLEGEGGEGFDLFLAAELLIYMGSLDALFAAMAARARPGALLAFSAEISTGPDYELTPSGRYAQSRSYLEGQLARVGGGVVAWETHPIRLHDDRPVEGYHAIAALTPTA